MSYEMSSKICGAWYGTDVLRQSIADKYEYVRQYFNNCCLRGVVRSVGRLR